jgi:hypothetical protein
MRVLSALVALVFALLPAPASAKSLAGSLHRFIENNASLFEGVADTLTPMLQRIAIRGTALPAPSSVPGITYTFDYDAGIARREVGAFGSIFVETPETVGRHALSLGTTYIHADLTQFDGDELAEQIDFSSRVPFVDGSVARTRLAFDEFAIGTNTVSLFATYGLTADWDLNLLLPLVSTALDVRANRFAQIDEVPAIDDVVGLHESTFGPGDLLVRTKYRLTPSGAATAAAAGVVLRAPTGNPTDFAGLGDWTVQPFMVGTRTFGRYELHGTLGFEFDADDLERSRVHYAIGTAIRVLDDVALLVDVLGSSGVADDRFEITGLGVTPRSRFLEQFWSRPPAAIGPLRVRVFPYVPRTDLVDLSIGCKVRLGDRAAAFAAVLVPIVRDGLRAEVAPTVGLQYTL